MTGSGRGTIYQARTFAAKAGDMRKTGSEMMTTTAPATVEARQPASATVLGKVASDERPVGRYDYEDGSYVQIMARGDIDTEEALKMVETLVALKRKELARRKGREIAAEANADAGDANEADTESEELTCLTNHRPIRGPSGTAGCNAGKGVE